MLSSFLPETRRGTWFLVATGFLEAVTQQHQQPRNLLHAKVEVPGKLQLFQPSTLRRRLSSSFWPFANMWREWLFHSGHCLTPACVRALCSVLVIDVNWLAAWTPHHWQDWKDIELVQVFVLPAWHQLHQLFDALLIFSTELEQVTWFLVQLAKGFLEAVRQQHQRSKNLLHTKVEVPGKLQLFQPSTLRRRLSSSFWPFANTETVERIVLSQGSLLDTCMCACGSLFRAGKWCELTPCMNVTSIGKAGKTLNKHKSFCFQHAKARSAVSSVLVIDMNWIAAWTPHNWQDWQDIELAQVMQVLKFFQHGNICSMLCSFLLGTGTNNGLVDRYEIPGSRHTAASASKALPNTASAKLKLSQL